MCMIHTMNHGSDHGSHESSEDELRHEVEILRLKVEKLEAEVDLLRQLLIKSGGEDHVR